MRRLRSPTGLWRATPLIRQASILTIERAAAQNRQPKDARKTACPTATSKSIGFALM
jgi:hypothetical protein